MDDAMVDWLGRALGWPEVAMVTTPCQLNAFKVRCPQSAGALTFQLAICMLIPATIYTKETK